MDPEQLEEFLDYVKDIKGYLTALSVNWPSFEVKYYRHLEILNKIGEEDVYPDEFYECVTELYRVLGLIMSVEPETEGEILPCIQVIDQLRAMFRVVH